MEFIIISHLCHMGDIQSDDVNDDDDDYEDDDGHATIR